MTQQEKKPSTSYYAIKSRMANYVQTELKKEFLLAKKEEIDIQEFIDKTTTYFNEMIGEGTVKNYLRKVTRQPSAVCFIDGNKLRTWQDTTKVSNPKQ